MMQIAIPFVMIAGIMILLHLGNIKYCNMFLVMVIFMLIFISITDTTVIEYIQFPMFVIYSYIGFLLGRFKGR